RVTHPHYHDFVRFEEVAYGTTTDVAVNLEQYPIVEQDVKGKVTNLDHVRYVDPPVWRRWYVTAPAAVVLLVGAGIVAHVLTHHFPSSDQCRKVGAMGC